MTLYERTHPQPKPVFIPEWVRRAKERELPVKVTK